ncbi:hypothetical protein S245_041163, partial [Arachis hypogaea]
PIGKPDSLSLASNQIEGHMLQNLGNLKSLKKLYFSNNSLSGSIPLTLCQLGNLSYLYLDSNQIEGQTPPEIGSLEALAFYTNLVSGTTLYLSHKKISSVILSELFKLPLSSLHLSTNQLVGHIPFEMRNSISLCYKDLSHLL